MNCEEVSRRLSAYLDGELPPAEAEQVERHLRDCPACGREYAELRQAAELLAGLPQETPPPAIAQGLRRRLRQRVALLFVGLAVVLLMILPAASVLGLALRADLPLWARFGFLLSGVCFAGALLIWCCQLLRRLQSLVAYGFLAGERTS